MPVRARDRTRGRRRTLRFGRSGKPQTAPVKLANEQRRLFNCGGAPQVSAPHRRHLAAERTVGVLSGLKWRSSDEVAQRLARLFRFVARELAD
jgi:hypothetical protein